MLRDGEAGAHVAVAIVAPRDAIYGMARMWEILVEGTGWDIRIVRLRDEALDEQDRVMLDFVAELTRDATRITPKHHARLRAVGFDDRGILRSR